jgi:hypothetical protein
MNARMLALLEQGHIEAEAALAALKAAWVLEDEGRKAHRAHILEAHAQGARDRDAMRVQLGGESLIAAEDARAREAAAARLKAADDAAAKLKAEGAKAQPAAKA